jgi:pimeloyl-ACP methyl ester carboxylesterase
MTAPYATVGSGDHRVLAVHGWFGSAHGWGALPEYVDRDDFTYVFMDLRGYAGRKDVSDQLADSRSTGLADDADPHLAQ